MPTKPARATVRYSEPALGFAVDCPGEWQVVGPTAEADPSMRSWYVVEFVSDLHAYGEQAFDRYSVSVAVGDSIGRTLTETVAHSLAPIAPPFRDQNEMRCCLKVGGEPALELAGFPLTRWGSRQVVVLHEGREYRLTFRPQIGLDGGTVSDATARAAFETFLRTFAFVSTAAPLPPAAPAVTPVATPMPVKTATADTTTTHPTGTTVPVPGITALPTAAATTTVSATKVTGSLLGEPTVLGRGQITDAAFTLDGAAVAIGWANGVSLVTVMGGEERWWQPTGVPVIAVDVHPHGDRDLAVRSVRSRRDEEYTYDDWRDENRRVAVTAASSAERLIPGNKSPTGLEQRPLVSYRCGHHSVRTKRTFRAQPACNNVNPEADPTEEEHVRSTADPCRPGAGRALAACGRTATPHGSSVSGMDFSRRDGL